MKSVKRSRPWIDKNGKKYCDEKLKVISKDWDQETWNQYLSKTVDVPQKESIFNRQE